VVVSYRLQQGPQLDVVLCQLGAVDRTAHHAAVGVRLWREEMQRTEPERSVYTSKSGEVENNIVVVVV